MMLGMISRWSLHCPNQGFGDGALDRCIAGSNPIGSKSRLHGRPVGKMKRVGYMKAII